MGSGSKFDIQLITDAIGLGFSIGRFPHQISIDIRIIVIHIYIGFGKGYDE